MNTTLLLVRHGESAGNALKRIQGWTDAELTPRGLRQAELLARHLSTRTGVSVLYSSPLSRAWKTASKIGEALGLEPVPDPGLKEMSFGLAEGLTMEELRALYPDVYSAWRSSPDPDFGWPGGETRRQFRRRVIGAIEEIRRRHAGEVVIVVAHGGTLGAYLAHAMTGDPNQWREYVLDNCSLTELELDGTEPPSLRCLNEMEHLSSLEEQPPEDGTN